jgi:hypothetical protein
LTFPRALPRAEEFGWFLSEVVRPPGPRPSGHRFVTLPCRLFAPSIGCSRAAAAPLAVIVLPRWRELQTPTPPDRMSGTAVLVE